MAASADSGASCDRIALGSEVGGEVFFHLGGGLIQENHVHAMMEVGSGFLRKWHLSENFVPLRVFHIL